MGVGSFALLIAGVMAGALPVWWHDRRQRSGAAAQRDRAVAAAAAAARTMRVWAAEFRSATMSLQGHADHCAGQCMQAPLLAGLGAALRQLVALGDDLQDSLAAADGSPVLSPEPVPLAPAVQDAIAAVNTGLIPAQRRWRLAAALDRITLHADHRALMEVLHRVLGNAARHSRPGDWIEIGLEARDDGVALVVADEGSGLCAPHRAAPPGQPESRGLGLGLALARRLMQAHGGALTVESAPRVGTRVTLLFPSGCVMADSAAG